MSANKPGFLNTITKLLGLVHRVVDVADESLGIIEDGVNTTRLHSQHMLKSTEVELSSELRELEKRIALLDAPQPALPAA